MLVGLDKEAGKGWGGGGGGGRGYDLKERKTWGREWGEGMQGSQSVISAGAERNECLLLGEACLTACSRGWVQHCGMTLLLNVCLCSYQIQRCSVCTGKRLRENGEYCIGKLVTVDIAVRFYAYIDRWDRGFCTQSIWWQGASAVTAGQVWCVPKTLFWPRYMQQHFGSFVGKLTDQLECSTECCYNLWSFKALLDLKVHFYFIIRVTEVCEWLKCGGAALIEEMAMLPGACSFH